MCNITTIKTDRLKWSTPENVKAWYDIVKETALFRGLAVVNPEYSVSKPDSPEIRWIHPDRGISTSPTVHALCTVASHINCGCILLFCSTQTFVHVFRNSMAKNIFGIGMMHSCRDMISVSENCIQST